MPHITPVMLWLAISAGRLVGICVVVAARLDGGGETPPW